MKKVLFVLWMFPLLLAAQTNTFPSSGNAGVGTTSPENSEGWQTVFQVYGEYHSKALVSSNGLTTGLWSHGSGIFGAPAGGITGTWSNHPFTVMTNKLPRMTFSNSGYVGIGTTSPSTKLQVVGSGGSNVDAMVNGRIQTGDGGGVGGIWLNSVQSLFIGQFNTTNIGFFNNGQWPMVIDNSGRVGIGTTTPLYPLHVKSDDQQLTLQTTGAVNNRSLILFQDASGVTRGSFGYHGADGSVRIGDGGGYRITMLQGGKVGIGTTTPDEKLTVNGVAHATRVKVDLTVPGPDYVFEKSYTLPTLKEVQSYIDENKHLPEVPSAIEMESKGIDVGEMNMLLLKKVEELTLYVLDQNKKMAEMAKLQQDQASQIVELRQNQVKK
jgi:hypothetical protein